ncbi:MAG TPA: 2-phospho-L-lactate guanylyltransferase [Micromonosporaceae bacterium]
MSWTVLVPVKRLELAKTRLRGAVPGIGHDELVLAVVLDTVSAALASVVVSRVVVVTNDPVAGAAAREAGAGVVADVPEAGINPALAYAATVVRPKASAASLPGVAALAADLPALRPAELTEALRTVDRRGTAMSVPVRAFVADAAGTGTVLLAAPSGARLEPCFGADSAAAHLASGAVRLTEDWPSLCRDVDTAADLAAARRLGLGPRSSALIAHVTGLAASPGDQHTGSRSAPHRQTIGG